MSRLKWLSLLVAFSALVPPGAGAALTEQGVENRLIIRFKKGMSALDERVTVQAQGLSVLDEIPRLNVLLAEAPAGRVSAYAAQLQADSNVLAVEPDVYLQWIDAVPATLGEAEAALHQLPKFAPSGPSGVRVMTGEAPGEVQWGVKRVNAPAAWSTNQGDGVDVAVIDTGIDNTNPDLVNRVSKLGYNAITKGSDWQDDHFHGTHVAGIIAAELDGKGVVGVAPKVTLHAVKVLTKEGKGDLFAIMDGISWCAQNGIKVANMSLGAPQEMPMLEYALQDAVNAGVTFVAAAGNDGKAVNWPAAYPEAIAVSALCPTGVTNAKLCPTANEGIATFSSRGPQVAFIAPGVLIPSTVPTSNDATGIHPYSGTSMATPHVTGLAALAVAKISASGGQATPDAVRQMLNSAAEPLSVMSREEQGAGVINAAKLAR